MIFVTENTFPCDCLSHKGTGRGLNSRLLWLRCVYFFSLKFGTLCVPDGNTFSTREIDIQPLYCFSNKFLFWNGRNLASSPFLKINETGIRHLTFDISLNKIRTGEAFFVQLSKKVQCGSERVQELPELAWFLVRWSRKVDYFGDLLFYE